MGEQIEVRARAYTGGTPGCPAHVYLGASGVEFQMRCREIAGHPPPHRTQILSIGPQRADVTLTWRVVGEQYGRETTVDSDPDRQEAQQVSTTEGGAR